MVLGSDTRSVFACVAHASLGRGVVNVGPRQQSAVGNKTGAGSGYQIWLFRSGYRFWRNSVMNPNKALWEKGDFTRLAVSMRKSGESLVNGLGITKGLKVLDLGCGDGTTALPEAMLGADVLGVDIASNLVAAGNKRARDAGLTNCKFQLGDACDLQELPDDSFDLIVSMFGAMFAPKPFEVAREMVRVS